jgi:hypothetical protein
LAEICFGRIDADKVNDLVLSVALIVPFKTPSNGTATNHFSHDFTYPERFADFKVSASPFQ